MSAERSRGGTVFDPKGPSLIELARQALSSTEHGYDLLAPKFDTTPFRTPDDLLAEVAPQIGAPGSIDSALDLCCGTGGGVRMLRPLCRVAVTGIDFSQGMLDEAKRRLQDAPGDAEIRLVRGDAFDVPWTDAFDVATCFGALGHIVGDDQPRFLRSVHRALVPGGRFVFVTTDHPSPLNPMWWAARGFNAAMHVRNALLDPPFVMFYLTFTLPGVVADLEAHGFRVEVRRDVFTGKYRWLRLVIATKPGV